MWKRNNLSRETNLFCAQVEEKKDLQVNLSVLVILHFVNYKLNLLCIIVYALIGLSHLALYSTL